jgi:hypothetical protein
LLVVVAVDCLLAGVGTRLRFLDVRGGRQAAGASSSLTAAFGTRRESRELEKHALAIIGRRNARERAAIAAFLRDMHALGLEHIARLNERDGQSMTTSTHSADHAHR